LNDDFSCNPFRMTILRASVGRNPSVFYILRPR
jgi:hypothetical protein